MRNSKCSLLLELVKSIEQLSCVFQVGTTRFRSKKLSSRDIVAFAIILIGFSWVPVSWAQDEQDEVGLFFDINGTSNSISTLSENEIVTAYLIIVNPSAPSGINSYSGTISWPGIYYWGFSSDCTDSWIPPPTLLLLCPEPLPWAPFVVLGEYNFIVPDPDVQIDLFVTMGEGDAPSYVPGGGSLEQSILLNPVSGSFELPVARINVAPVSQTKSPWGTIKSIYR